MTKNNETRSWKVWRREYKALKEVIEDNRLPRQVRAVAQSAFNDLELATFTVTMNCLLCKQDYDWTGVMAAQMAEWRDDPRGVCGPCNAKATIEVLRIKTPITE